MTFAIERLAAVAHELGLQKTLEEQLQILVERSAELLIVPRVTVRLLDPSGTRLLAKARAGLPLHRGPFAEFGVGEGLIGWVAQTGKPLLAGDAEADPRFARRPGMLEPLGSFVGVPLLAREHCIGVLGASHPEREHFTLEHEQMLTVLAALCAPHIEVARLERMARVDALTGALNRHGLDLVLDELPAQGRLLSVVLCDIDRFKQVNDRLGHDAGDQVLKRVALVLASGLRGGDSVVRYGGEEFLLVLPDIDLKKAERIAERARHAVEEETLIVAGSSVRVTFSAGVAERHGAEGRDQLLRRADQALYAAKESGRNRVHVAA
jgi:diguanylate cyclase (GGDEF)-like protein